MRAILAALSLCLVPISAQAKPTLYPEDKFLGDRWLSVAQSGASAEDVERSLRCAPPRICRSAARKHKLRRWKSRSPVAFKKRIVIVKPEPMPVRAVIVPMPRIRPADAPEGDDAAAAFNEAWNRIAVSLRTSDISAQAIPPVRMNLFTGFAREIARAVGSPKLLMGVVPTLADKARQLAARCGSKVISGRRNTRVAGSGRISLHASGRAVDMAGNPSCMYGLLRRWPGGVSIDYARVRHIHISYSPKGREWGMRFAHYRGGVKRTRYARDHRINRHRRYASR